MRRLSVLFLLALLHASSAGASTLVLPFQAVGFEDATVTATATTAASLIREDLQELGVAVVSLTTEAAAGPGTDDPVAATEAARSAGADRVVYGTLTLLGEKVICRVRVLKVGDAAPAFNDQLSSASIEDLDVVMRRFAEAIATGQPKVGGPNVDTVTQAESRKPRTQASRRGMGLRAGFLWPVGDSYGGAERLTSIRIPFKYETRGYFLETTTLTGLAWGTSDERNKGKAVDWTILDLYGAKIYGLGDRATYLGGGLGVHSVWVHRNGSWEGAYPPNYGFGDESWSTREDSQTTLTADAGVGELLLRTHDFQVVVDLRYHVTFSPFQKAGGKGAHGVALTFGTTR